MCKMRESEQDHSRPLGPLLDRDFSSHDPSALKGDVRDALAVHLACFVRKHRNALVFTDEGGEPLVRRAFEADVWRPALAAVGLAEEDHGIDTLGTARLWEWMHEATAQRASLRAGSDQRQGATND